MSPGPYPRSTARPRKGMATASLILGILSVLTLGGLGVGALTGLVLGIVALVRANGQPAVYGGKGAAIGGIVTSGLAVLMAPFAIIAAIAIPSLLRARVMANESAAIGDIRTVISAQAAYQSANGGYFEGRLPCLTAPADGCIPDYPAMGPTFLDPQLTSLSPKMGYERRFDVGPGPTTDFDPRSSSPTSVSSFAYVAVPIRAGQTGIRGFCGDASGIICFTADGSAPRVAHGACDVSSCKPLR